MLFSDTCADTHSAMMWEEILYGKTLHKQVVLETHYSISSGSQSMLCRSRAICGQSPRDSWIHFCIGYFEGYSVL